MKQLRLRIRLTAAVASLAASFPSVASVHSDDADGTELRSQHADEATWSLLMFPQAPACLISASESGLEVLRLTVPGTSTQAEGVVHPPHENVTFGGQQARDLHSVGPEVDDFRDGEGYTDLWERIRAGFALPSIKSPRVACYEAQYLRSPRHLRRVIERSRPSLYFIVGELERRGMPAEIALLPIIESAYNPQAVSPKRAAGLWQFMPATGRQYGLHRDPWYDGRRDVVAATRAALDYLQFLHYMFDDWELALAAYNWGERAVLRARVKNAARGRPTRYGSLKMPDETRNYLPQLQALKNLIGSSILLELAALPNEPYFAQMKTPEAVDVVKLGRLADMPVEQFRSLNPGYRGPVIIQTTMRSILLPVEKLDCFKPIWRGTKSRCSRGRLTHRDAGRA